MQIKILSCFSLIFILVACSYDTEKYICGSDGLILTKEKATFAFYPDFEFCKKMGVINLYKRQCGAEISTTLYFDTVAKTLSGTPINGTIQCKKVN